MRRLPKGRGIEEDAEGWKKDELCRVLHLGAGPTQRLLPHAPFPHCRRQDQAADRQEAEPRRCQAQGGVRSLQAQAGGKGMRRARAVQGIGGGLASGVWVEGGGVRAGCRQADSAGNRRGSLPTLPACSGAHVCLWPPPLFVASAGLADERAGSGTRPVTGRRHHTTALAAWQLWHRERLFPVLCLGGVACRHGAPSCLAGPPVCRGPIAPLSLCFLTDPRWPQTTLSPHSYGTSATPCPPSLRWGPPLLRGPCPSFTCAFCSRDALCRPLRPSARPTLCTSAHCLVFPAGKPPAPPPESLCSGSLLCTAHARTLVPRRTSAPVSQRLVLLDLPPSSTACLLQSRCARGKGCSCQPFFPILACGNW